MKRRDRRPGQHSHGHWAVGRLPPPYPRAAGIARAVLLPSEPSEDLKDLLGEEYVELVYQTEDGGFAGWPLAYNQP